MNLMTQRVMMLATCVRTAFEQIADEEDDYDPDLQGLCGRAAVQFCLAAEQHGMEGVRLVHSYGHAFSTLPDGRIVDVTATQFNYGFVGTPPDGYAEVEIGRQHDELPRWYKEDVSWGSVSKWLEEAADEPNENRRDLYGARKNWEDDYDLVTEIWALGGE